MNVLVINTGSLSSKVSVIEMPSEKTILSLKIDKSGNSEKCTIDGKPFNKINSLDKALLMIRNASKIDFITHRFVHGLDIMNPLPINNHSLRKLKNLTEFAPIHNAISLKAINESLKIFPKTQHLAVFDTSFHSTIPKENYLYPIPLIYYEKYKIRKYGFHGISLRYCLKESEKILKKQKPSLIVCHLGGGSSVTAIKSGKSVDTTMGFSPISGLFMGTRSGDIDVSIIPFLARKEKMSPEDVLSILNEKSGFMALAGKKDFREIHQSAEKGNISSIQAMKMYENQLIKQIGAYKSFLQKVDAIVFTGAIGRGADYLRENLLKYFPDDVFITIESREDISMARDAYKY